MNDDSQAIGWRIALARKASGLSLRELADQVGISHTQVAKFEKGSAVPGSRMLLQLGRAVGVKVEWFLRPRRPVLSGVEYRSKKKELPKKDRDAIEAVVLDHFDRRLEVESLFPESVIQNFGVCGLGNASITSPDEIEHVADALRKHWDLGSDPVPDLVDICESRGLRVFCKDSQHGDFDGLAGTVGGWPIIVINGRMPGDRQRFSLAHEVGHIVLKDRLVGFDTPARREKAAHRFAGAFLFPADKCRKILGTKRKNLDFREIHMLKHEWGLSMGAILHRTMDLEIISREKYGKLYGYMKREWGKEQEPGEQYPREQSHIFKTMVYRAFAEHLIGESKAAELLGVSMDTFRRWPENSFDDDACSDQ